MASGSKMNLYDLSGSGRDAERFDQLLSQEGVRIERIVSNGQSTPEGEWYDQDWDEWVIVISGRASIRYEGKDELCLLKAGDSLFLPAHCRHRVEWTDSEQPTIWLAVHINAPRSENTGGLDE